jgi:hypothetical protein
MAKYYALRLDVQFKSSLSWIGKDIETIIASVNALKDGVKLGMHTEKTICMVFVTQEHPRDPMERLKPLLAELNSVNNYWCGDCPDNFIGMNGSYDPATVAIQEAWRTADFLTATQEDVNDTKARKRGV